MKSAGIIISIMLFPGQSPDSELHKQPWPWLMRAAGGQCRLSRKQVVQRQDAGWLIARFQDGKAAGRLDKQACHFADREVAPESRGLFEDGRAILPPAMSQPPPNEQKTMTASVPVRKTVSVR